MQRLLEKQWHHLSSSQLAELLDTNLQNGLDAFEVHHRQERFGPNQLTPHKGKGPLARFLSQFHNPLIYILLASSLITATVKGELLDAAIILGVVLINAAIGYIQESRAEKAIQALSASLTSEATVLRAGETRRIPSEALVPGDLVVIRSGDRVPADLRLVHLRDLQISEAALTGESVPVRKTPSDDLPVDVPLAERSNMAFASTLVTYGQGRGVVVATGDNTEIGRISQLITAAEQIGTPLQRKISQFSSLLLWAILALAGVTFVIGVLRGQPVMDNFTAAIALAVAAIPEGLPAALTVTLAIGVARMARRRAIIRRLPAVETLGSVTVIASDKTGTLTQNQMTVQEIALPAASFRLTGSGYSPSGEILPVDPPSSTEADRGLAELLRAGVLCNDSRLMERDGRWSIEGDPTEAALLVSARKGGLDERHLNDGFPRLDEIPFDSQHQYMATLHSTGPADPPIAYIKGAVEVILDGSESALQGRQVPLDRQRMLHQAESLATRGLRVLAFARKELPAGTQRLSHEMLSSGLTFLGLQGMIDPPRPEAIEAIRTSQKAGINIKMITGDHPLTAAAIAGQIGLGTTPNGPHPRVLTGSDLAHISDAALVDVAYNTNVFARVTPEQKLRLVEALQARGEVVAMTGDGVNDAPALKQADIGIAMGLTGTDVSKEAADMVLTDDNFATIEAAIEEGRGVFDNLTKIIAWTLPTNVGLGLIILLAVFLGIALPILPVQILWINMISAVALGLVLAVENREPGIMFRPPRDPQEPILTRNLLWRILIVGFLISTAAFGLYEWALMSGASLATARTVAVNAVIMIEIFYLVNARSLTQSPFSMGLFSNRWIVVGVLVMLLLQALFTYAPWMNHLFSSAPISTAAWTLILLAAFTGFWLIELEKWLRRRSISASSSRRAVSRTEASQW